MSKENELLPCPFCGGTAKLGHNTQGREYWYATCERCDFDLDMPTLEKAIANWNIRPLPTPVSLDEVARKCAEEIHPSFDINWFEDVAHGQERYRPQFESAERQREQTASLISRALTALTATLTAERDALKIKLERAKIISAYYLLNCTCEANNHTADETVKAVADKVRELDAVKAELRVCAMALESITYPNPNGMRHNTYRHDVDLKEVTAALTQPLTAALLKEEK